MTPEECSMRLAGLADGPTYFTQVDITARIYLAQFAGDRGHGWAQRTALIAAIQDLPDFALKDYLLDRLGRL